jgi:hypothetical protein
LYYKQPCQATVRYYSGDKIHQQAIAHFGTFANTHTFTVANLRKSHNFSRHCNLQLYTRLIFATVKNFTFIFSFYILFLSTVPCCAVYNCNDEAQETKAAGKHEHNDSCKNCSPFALCGNCVGFTLIANNFQVGTPQQLTQQTFPGCTQSYLTLYISSVWQPPRLG